METKKCSKCHQELSLSEFYIRNRRGKAEYMSVCKKCDNKQSRKYQEKNKEKVKQKAKEWREKNREKLKIALESWRNKNKDHIKKYKNEYYHNHQEEIKRKASEYFHDNKERIIESRRPYHSKYYQDHREKLKQEAEQNYWENRSDKLKYQKERRKNLDPQKVHQYNQEYRNKNLQKLRDHANKKHLEKMQSIYGQDWKGRHWHGENLTAKILHDMFPGIKILRGVDGKIDTSKTDLSKIRKCVYPDFRFFFLDKEIIIEYNGRQHYEHVPKMMSMEKFIETQKRDKWLKKYCKQNNIIFVEVDERNGYCSENKIIAQIQKGLKKHGLL